MTPGTKMFLSHFGLLEQAFFDKCFKTQGDINSNPKLAKKIRAPVLFQIFLQNNLEKFWQTLGIP